MRAQEFAFADAGIDPLSTKIVRTEFDFEYGQFVYEVEFIANGVEYDYWIKASDGTVLKRESEGNEGDWVNRSDTTKSTQDPAKGAAQKDAQVEASGTSIDLETAKSKALADAAISPADATFTKQSLEYDDRTQIYDIEFYTETHEYEYEIDAVTGAVYDKSVEAFTANPNANQRSVQGNGHGNSESMIDIEQAKSIAVEKAGFLVGDVTFKKAKLDYDDGYTVYEIEFYKNGMEYHCTINATTGTILEYDVDRND